MRGPGDPGPTAVHPHTAKGRGVCATPRPLKVPFPAVPQCFRYDST